MKNSANDSKKLIYRLSYGSFGQFIKVSVTVKDVKYAELEIFLSSWRPGRYESGYFAGNIRHFKVTSATGNELSFQKVLKDRWKVITNGNSEIVIEYEYYAVRPDAGSCWLNDDVFYVNPIHCCIGITGMEHEPCSVMLNLPAGFTIATAMTSVGQHEFMVTDFDELVDSPILASPALLHEIYAINGITFHLWFYGLEEVDWKKVIFDFREFTKVQLATMGDFPVMVYHFLTLALPFRFYHGVEHLKSTVLALGPAGELMKAPLYSELVGVASHELFHVWNVKTIRPAEMLPYNYSRENYSTSGWVYEGITTYYGDLFLARSGFFSQEDYFAEITKRLQKHLDNPGKDNYNVLESSFDTWLDGYEPGVPGRKTSIYDEGSLIALMFDLYIRIQNRGKSLDDFMLRLYQNFGKQKSGYTHHQVLQLLNETAGNASLSFFEEKLNYKGSYLPFIKELFENLSIGIQLNPNPLVHEQRAGFRLDESIPYPRVSIIQPGSPSERAGIMHGDEMVDMMIDNNALAISVLRYKKPKHFRIKLSASETYFDKVHIYRLPDPSPVQESAFVSWFKGRHC